MSRVEQKDFKLSSQQWEFFNSGKPFPAYGGGWGNGKTLVGCLKSYHICSQYPDSRFIIGRQNFTDLRDSTLSDFLELYGSDGPFGKYHAGEMKYVLKNGSEILFRHFSNLQSLTNLNLSGGWIDQAEEVSEDAFLFLRGRMRRKSVPLRQLMATFNMEGHNWIWKYWKQSADEDFHLIEADSYANRKHLPEDYLKNLEKLPTELYDRYVMGSWDQFEGQIYTEFDESVHVIQPFEIPEWWPMFEGIDVGVRNPTAYVQMFEDEESNLYVSKCFSEPNLKPDQVAERIHRYRMGRNAIETVIDPASARTNETNHENFKQQLADFEVYANAANNKVLAGISRVKHWLDHRKLFIFNTCPDLIEEIRQYQWEKPRTIKGVVYHHDRPLKVNDHLVDALRYVVMSRPDFHEVKKPEKKPEGITLNMLEAQIEEKRWRDEMEYFT